MSNIAAAGGLRILATQHSVPEALRRVRSMALERHGILLELLKNIAGLGALAAAAAEAG
jgi:hypothetical protein